MNTKSGTSNDEIAAGNPVFSGLWLTTGRDNSTLTQFKESQATAEGEHEWRSWSGRVMF